MANNAQQAPVVSRPMSSQRAGRNLRRSVILSGKGAFKAPISGLGNLFVREDGTTVKIYNVAAFPTQEIAAQAKALYMKGIEAELAQDPQGAHKHFTAALNLRLSFSVRVENAAAFDSSLEIVGIADQFESKLNPGTMTWGINTPRPVAIAAAVSAANLFEIPVPPSAVTV